MFVCFLAGGGGQGISSVRRFFEAVLLQTKQAFLSRGMMSGQKLWVSLGHMQFLREALLEGGRGGGGVRGAGGGGGGEPGQDRSCSREKSRRRVYSVCICLSDGATRVLALVTLLALLWLLARLRVRAKL